MHASDGDTDTRSGTRGDCKGRALCRRLGSRPQIWLWHSEVSLVLTALLENNLTNFAFRYANGEKYEGSFKLGAREGSGRYESLCF